MNIYLVIIQLGELYLDEAKPEFKNFEELSILIHKDLHLADLTKNK